MPNREKISSFLSKVIEIDTLVMIFCLPFSKSILEICAALSIAAFLIKKIYCDRELRLRIDRSILALLLAFVFFNALSLVNSQYLRLSAFALISKVLKPALLFLAVADTIRRPEQLKRIIIVMVLASMLILSDAFYQQYGAGGRDFLHYPKGYKVFKFEDMTHGATTFPTASFPYPNDFAAWLNVYLFTFLYIALFGLKGSRMRFRILLLILCGLMAFFLLLTTASSALIGTLIASSILILLNIRKLLFPLIILVVVTALIVSSVPYLKKYAREILNEAPSISDRTDMWQVGWRIFKNHPIIGNGVNTFFEHFKNFRTDEYKGKKGSYAHNCYLQMASDIGLLGLLSFLSFALLVICSKMRRTLKDPWVQKNAFVLGTSLGSIAFLVHSSFDTNLYSLNLAALFWLSLGLIEGMGGEVR